MVNWQMKVIHISKNVTCSGILSATC